MTSAPIPANDAQRIEHLRSYQILDTAAEAKFDQLAFLASQLCETPVALITLVDEHRQWFKSSVGTAAKETPRQDAFCAHAILQSGVFVVSDATADERFQANPLVVGPAHVRAYAGAPLINAQGFSLGTVCVIDHKPRDFTEAQKLCLHTIASQAVLHMELHRLRNAAPTHAEHAAGLLAAVSHELRTPLNGLMGASEMLLDSPLSDEQHRWAELAQKSTLSLVAAVEQVLALGQEIARSGLGRGGGAK
jgi:GAF domain-containing protein